MRHPNQSDFDRWEPVVSAIREVQEKAQAARSAAVEVWASGPKDAEDTAVFQAHMGHIDRVAAHFYRAIESHWAGPGAANSISYSHETRGMIIEIMRAAKVSEPRWLDQGNDEPVDRSGWVRQTGLPETEKRKLARNWRRQAENTIRESSFELDLIEKGWPAWEEHFGVCLGAHLRPSYEATMRAQLATWKGLVAEWDANHDDHGARREVQP